MKLIRATSIVTITLLASAITALLTTSASSASAAGFEAGRIIDDGVMVNSNSMTVTEIQRFLESKVSACDTYGQKLSEYGGPDLNGDGKVQRWEWGKSKYNQTTFPCLKDYVQNGKKASQLIYDAGKKYTINPQVLIVLLQKEQGLVTDTWPLNVQYRSATGYGCPDTAPCDSDYYGLTNQLDWAAKMFRSIINQNPNWYSPYFKGNNPRIYWHPSSSCGYQSLNIQNWSTASFYSYTPYRPNQAALDAGYGTGNSCSSYGNRNFHLYFNDWFGSTKGANITYSGIKFTTQPFTDAPVSATFTVKNTSKTKITLGRLKVETRSPSGTQYDFPSVSNVTIDPGKTYTYRESRIIPEEGVFNIKVARYHNNSWITPPFSDFNYINDTSISAKFTKKPTVTQSLNLNKSSVHKDEIVTANFSIRNNSTTQTVNVGRTKIEGRHSDGTQYDFPSTVDNLTLQPGETYQYSESRSLPKTGNYTFRLMNVRQTYGWSSNFPVSEGSNIVRSLKQNVKQPVTVTSSLSMPITSDRIGEPITTNFTLKNHSTKPVNIGRMKVEGRHSDGTQYDFPSTVDNLTLQPGATYTYSETRVIGKTGTFTFRLMNFREKERWSSTFPQNETSTVGRTLKMNMKEAVTAISSLSTKPYSAADLSTSPTNLHVNEPVTATFTIKNHSTEPVNIGRMKVEAWHSDNTQYNFPSSADNTVIQPGETFTYTGTRSLPKNGVYTIQFVNYRDKHGWSTAYPVSETSDLERRVQATVKTSATVTDSLSISSTSPRVNEPVTASFTIKNHSTEPVNIGRMKVEGRHSDGTQYDFPSTVDNLTLQPGEAYIYDESRSFNKSGNFTLKLMNVRTGIGWSSKYPESENSQIIRQQVISIDN